jgi:hypothetical protein
VESKTRAGQAAIRLTIANTDYRQLNLTVSRIFLLLEIFGPKPKYLINLVNLICLQRGKNTEVVFEGETCEIESAIV